MNLKDKIIEKADGEKILFINIGINERDWPGVPLGQFEGTEVPYALDKLDYEVADEYNGECHAFMAWTAGSIIGVRDYDGKKDIVKIPRNPDPDFVPRYF